MTTGAQRLGGIAEKGRWCPDLRYDNHSLLESKGRGNSGSLILYEGRLDKDRYWIDRARAWNAGDRAQLYYFMWCHRFLVASADNLTELRTGLAAHTYELVIVNLDVLESVVRPRPTRLVNSAFGLTQQRNGYGNTKKGYGIGWTIAVSDFKQHCLLTKIIEPGAAVFGHRLGKVNVYVSNPEESRFFHDGACDCGHCRPYR